MTFVRFTRTFDFADPDTSRRTRFPVGWGGEVDAKVEQAARAAGVLVVDPTAPLPGDAPVDPGGDLDGMTKDELLAEAERRKVTVSSSATKADIVTALTA